MTTEMIEHRSFSMQDLTSLADTVAASKMFSNLNKQQVLVLLMMADADGIHPMKAMQKYHVINGKPSMRSDAMLAEFQSRGGKINWTHTGKDGEKAEAEFIYNDQSVTYAFTVSEARKAGIFKNTWTKYPGAMLRARVISNGVRMICPEAVMGVYTPEEVESFTTPQKPQEFYTEDREALKAVAVAKPERVNITPVKEQPEVNNILTDTVEEIEPSRADMILTINKAKESGSVDEKALLDAYLQSVGKRSPIFLNDDQLAELIDRLDHVGGF